jgi:hypothetical protein
MLQHGTFPPPYEYNNIRPRRRLRRGTEVFAQPSTRIRRWRMGAFSVSMATLEPI